MPRAYAWQPATSGLTYVFDVDDVVGLNAANKRDDVFLIQWMLAVWMSRENDPRFVPLIIQQLPGPLLIDGMCGKQTITAIRILETLNPQLAKDGKIHPFTTAHLGGTGRKIQLLNELCGFAGQMKGRLPEIPIPFPAAIKRLLFMT